MQSFAIFDSAAGLASSVFHGISQGVITATSGDDFKSGFMGALIGHSVGAKLWSIAPGSGPGSKLARTMIAAVSGGFASKWGGGKFANGAVSAAFVHLFNSEARLRKEGKIILFGPGKHRLMVTDKNWHEGTFGVYGHATSDSIFDDRSGSRITMNADEFAEFLKNNGWQEEQNITLIACHSGEGVNSFAEQLSNKLNVVVTAPNDYVWLNHIHMKKAVGGSFLGFPRGGWVEFYPQNQ